MRQQPSHLHARPSLAPICLPQYCDRGSLADALAERRLAGKDGQPHMVRRGLGLGRQQYTWGRRRQVGCLLVMRVGVAA